jgi:hypothetical protein
MSYVDRELKVELVILDVDGRRRAYAVTWAPFGPSAEDPTLHLTTGLTTVDLAGVKAELHITDPLGPRDG